MSWHKPAMILSVIAIVLGVGLFVSLHAQARRGGTIAVVDIQEVFNQLTERADVEADIKARIDNLEKWEQDKQTELRQLKADLDIMSPDSPNFERTREKPERAVIALQVEIKIKQRQLEQEKAIQLEALYRKIIAGIGTIAQQRGYELVLLKDQMPDLRGANQQQIAALIQVRKLLYSADHLDITDQIKQKLNNDYATKAAD
jgi:Skp family chaperone for outer membrane proteins